MNSSSASSCITRTRAELILRFSFYAAGVIGMLVLYGLLQERIMTVPYEAVGGGVLFKDCVFLVMLNRLAAMVFAIGMAAKHGEELRCGAPLWKYLIVSASNVFASSCQYEALKYVCFAMQMLAKSFKMMPVMIWGIMISGKKYGIRDWLVALTVTAGVAEFLLTGPAEANTELGNSVIGLMWLFAYLAFDGLTSTMQEKLFREHSTSKYNQMIYINGLSLIVSVTTLLITQRFLASFYFFSEQRQFRQDAMLLTLSAVGGQFFIYSQLEYFGALVFAATLNVRQLVSIILSYVVFHHTMTPWQGIGIVLVFGALLYKAVVAFRSWDAEQAPLVDPGREDRLIKRVRQDYKATGNIIDKAAEKA